MAQTMGHKQNFVFNGLNLTSALASDVKLTIGAEEIDVSTIGSNWKGFDQGQADASFAVSGVWDNGTAVTALDKVAFANINAGGTKLFEYEPGGSVQNYPKFTGNGFLTAYEVGGAVGDKVGFSVNIRVAGSVTQGVVA